MPRKTGWIMRPMTFEKNIEALKKIMMMKKNKYYGFSYCLATKKLELGEGIE
jgi:hypothetical protein